MREYFSDALYSLLKAMKESILKVEAVVLPPSTRLRHPSFPAVQLSHLVHRLALIFLPCTCHFRGLGSLPPVSFG